jgi:hypothetical protein
VKSAVLIAGRDIHIRINITLRYVRVIIVTVQQATSVTCSE